ncbi:uncharacterized protein LOC135090698 [Scylla paramamosain]|uniref:uncharacterized protein LOC135090698 n=1 Tax=Scylla paramamosain TaxID=85552 RepID=UPI003083DD9B
MGSRWCASQAFPVLRPPSFLLIVAKVDPSLKSAELKCCIDCSDRLTRFLHSKASHPRKLAPRYSQVVRRPSPRPSGFPPLHPGGRLLIRTASSVLRDLDIVIPGMGSIPHQNFL